jgi:hypothetical protein
VAERVAVGFALDRSGERGGGGGGRGYRKSALARDVPIGHTGGGGVWESLPHGKGSGGRGTDLTWSEVASLATTTQGWGFSTSP